LTAAHCVETEFSHNIGQNTYSVRVNNPYDASMYSVYVGAFDVSFLSFGGNPPPTTVKMAVKRVIPVSFFG
jgi:hypothetical protein